jgi:Uma2 family endonuclease
MQKVMRKQAMLLEAPARWITVEEFDEFITRPENANADFEYIAGRIVEVVSNGYSSEIGATALAEIRMFVKGKDLGRVTGADGGYMVSGERYIPDVGFITKARQPEPSYVAYNPLAPDLAVEVLSPSNKPDEVRFKLINYLRAGTIVWLVDPDNKRVEIYVPNQPPHVLGIDSVIDGGALLPGFKLAVRDLFGS